MQIRVEIVDAGTPRSYTNPQTGVVSETLRYAAFLHVPGLPYPVGPFEVRQPRDTPLEQGHYDLGPKSFEVEKGRLQFSYRLDLKASAGVSNKPPVKAA